MAWKPRAQPGGHPQYLIDKLARLRVVLPFLYMLALLTPGANYQIFSGIPLSTIPEFLFAAALAPFVVSPSLRRLLRRNVHSDRLVAAVLIVGSVTLIAAKLWLFAAGESRGLGGCYRSLAAPPPGTCERSFENPFAQWDVTRIDREIEFSETTWRLSFINSLRFNFWHWVPGTVLRDRVPILVIWGGYLHDPRVRQITVEWVGEGTIQVGGSSQPLARDYISPRLQTIDVPPGIQPVVISYRFDDGSRAGQTDLGPFASFRLTFLDERGRPVSPVLTPSSHVNVIRHWIAGGIDLMFLGLGGVIAWFYWRLLRPDLRWSLPAALAFLALARLTPREHPWSPILIASAATGVLAATLLSRHRRAQVSTYALLFVLAFVTVLPLYSDLQAVALRPGGEDWLTYESHARLILETKSLQGGEAVFYYQPLFRYVRALERLLLGDGEALIVVSAFMAFLFSVVWMLTRVHVKGSYRSVVLCAVAGGLMFALITTAGLTFFRAPASEYPTWIILPLSTGLLFGTGPGRGWLTGAILLGLQAITRLNQLPPIVLTYLAFIVGRRSHWRYLLVTASGFGLILLLPLVHNLYFGERTVFFTTSGDIPDNLQMTPTILLTSIGESHIRDFVEQRLRALFAVDKLPSPAAYSVHSLQILWALTCVYALRHFRLIGLDVFLLAAVPATYLAVHLFYQVGVYYPRHIIAGHLAMGTVSAVIGCSILRRQAQFRRRTRLSQRRLKMSLCFLEWHRARALTTVGWHSYHSLGDLRSQYSIVPSKNASTEATGDGPTDV